MTETTRKIDAGGLEFSLPLSYTPLNHIRTANFPEELERTTTDLRLAGELKATALVHSLTLDADYKAWVATQMNAHLGREAKMAQWKIMSSIESSGGWLDRKHNRAKAQAALVAIDGHIAALNARLSALQALMANSN